MKQYMAIKARYPGALLLFRVGDFYETFGEDAVKAAGILGIVLTKRANGAASHIELAGFPHHSLDTYLPKLVRAGQRVAICDQLEDPKTVKGIVKRGVTELVTPGVATGDNILQQKRNNYLAVLHLDKTTAGVAFLDISTGEFQVAQGSVDYIDKLLQSLKPSEVVFSKAKRRDVAEIFGDQFYTYNIDDWAFSYDYAEECLLKHFEVRNLKGFGIERMQAAIIAAGVAIHYLNDTEHRQLQHISSLSRIEESKYVWLDRFTIRNLELITPNSENARTLLDVLDQTCTAMGARLLRRWLVMPLKNKKSIEERLSVVDWFLAHREESSELENAIQQVGDLERLISKIGLQKANPRELAQLKRALFAIENIQAKLAATDNQALKQIADQLNPCLLIREKLDQQLQAEPPVMLAKGGVMAEGVDEQLDKLRVIAFKGKDFLLALQKREAEATGIPSLKVSFNNVFGYYLEVTHAHKDKVPGEWIRKQTLVN
ncbi:MAG: DNA mismatch repair protein MutS, partial [Mucilaginibacter polytrichastri]|nr:DNA mismatch repair protein MutS [Mucilaginibacter polytrichastri]